MFEGFSAHLAAGGIQIQRGCCAIRVLHPLYQGFGLVWRRGVDGVEEEIYTAANSTADVWQHSTLKVMVDDGEPELCRRIHVPEPGEEFPILENFCQEGATDYFGMICDFAIEAANEQRLGVVFTWTPGRDSGFGDIELDFPTATLPTLTLTHRVATNPRFAQAVADAYFGHDAAPGVEWRNRARPCAYFFLPC